MLPHNSCGNRCFMPFGPDKSSCPKFGHSHPFPSLCSSPRMNGSILRHYTTLFLHYFDWKYATARGHLSYRSTEFGNLWCLARILSLSQSQRAQNPKSIKRGQTRALLLEGSRDPPQEKGLPPEKKGSYRNKLQWHYFRGSCRISGKSPRALTD